MTKSERKRDVPAYISFCAITILCFAVLLVILVCRILVMNPDNDMWWMMATGREIVETHSLPHTNGFVLHEGLSMIVEQWPVAVLNFGVYEMAGNAGLMLLAGFGVALCLALAYVYAGQYTDSILKRFWGVIWAELFLMAFCTTRPTLFSIAFLLSECILFEKYYQTRKKGYLYSIAFLSVGLVNVHQAMWPMLFIAAAPFFVRDRKHWKQYMFPGILCFLVGFVNPNGTDGVLFLWKAMTGSDLINSIQEMQPPTVLSFFGICLIGIAILFLCYLFQTKKRADSMIVLMTAGTFLLAIMHRRSFWFLILGVIPLWCELGLERMKRGIFPRIARSLFVILLTGSIIVVSCIDWKDIHSRERVFPKTAAYLEQAEEIRLYTDINTGGYMEWMGYKPYIDARVEQFHKRINGVKNICDEFMAVDDGYADYESFLEEYDFTHLFVKEGLPFDSFLCMSEGYKKSLTESGYVLYEKRK